ncbi:MAG: hypothetical protein HQL25_08090, partial [Candidatus Omnitrophica bacterium]|nr:hypothetical protein [Candidatus Omnitrophota bacterium]
MFTRKTVFKAAIVITFLLYSSIQIQAADTKTVIQKKPTLDELIGKPVATSKPAVQKEPTTKTSSKQTTNSTQNVSTASTSLSAGSSGADSSLAAPLQQQFHFDSFSGAGVFAFPISAPAGRAGIQPSLGVSYSPRQGNGLLGVGWDLSIGFIERSTKKGIPKYDATDEFIANIGGSSIEL